MEYLDILDEEGLPTGRTGTKDEVKLGGHWHRVVNVWITNSRRELLFQKRPHTLKYFPGYWSVTGGHVSAGENPAVCAARELSEELGLNPLPEELQFLFTDKSVYPVGEHRFRVFRDVFLFLWNGPPTELSPDPREVADLNWMPEESVRAHYGAANGDFFPLPAAYLEKLWPLLETRIR